MLRARRDNKAADNCLCKLCHDFCLGYFQHTWFVYMALSMEYPKTGAFPTDNDWMIVGATMDKPICFFKKIWSTTHCACGHAAPAALPFAVFWFAVQGGALPEWRHPSESLDLNQWENLQGRAFPINSRVSWEPINQPVVMTEMLVDSKNWGARHGNAFWDAWEPPIIYEPDRTTDTNRGWNPTTSDPQNPPTCMEASSILPSDCLQTSDTALFMPAMRSSTLPSPATKSSQSGLNWLEVSFPNGPHLKKTHPKQLPTLVAVEVTNQLVFMDMFEVFMSEMRSILRRLCG